MSITIISKDAKFHAGNISRIVGPKMFTQAQLVRFYKWLDSHIRSGVDDANKSLSASAVVGAAPYDFSRSVTARNPILLAGYTYKKDDTVPAEVKEIFGKLFSSSTLPPFKEVELLELLDSLVTLVGYDFRDDKKTLSREDIAELVLMSVDPDIAHEVNMARLAF